MPPSTSGRWVDRAIGAMRSTRDSPASMSTPASLYVIAIAAPVPHNRDRAPSVMLWLVSPPLIDVVVPARDHAASLGVLLRALPHRAIRSVVVVDRASTDRTAEVA